MAPDQIKNDMGQAILLRTVEHVFVESTFNNNRNPAMRSEWYVLEGPNAGSIRTGLILGTRLVAYLVETAVDGGSPMVRRLMTRPIPERPEARHYVLEPVDDPELLERAERVRSALGW
jgi:hypothetical protein